MLVGCLAVVAVDTVAYILALVEGTWCEAALYSTQLCANRRYQVHVTETRFVVIKTMTHSRDINRTCVSNANSKDTLECILFT